MFDAKLCLIVFFFVCLAFFVTFNVTMVLPLALFSLMGELFITKKSVNAKIFYKCDTVL